MASQNMAGVSVIRNAEYDIPISPVIAWTGIATLLLAPFGAFALNLAAITAAISIGPEGRPDRRKRYIAAVAAGVFYLLLGIFGGAVTGPLAAFPKEMAVALLGFGTIGAGLASALKEEPTREAALVTFLVTLSGLTLWNVSSAFWGMVAGPLVLIRMPRSPATIPAKATSANDPG